MFFNAEKSYFKFLSVVFVIFVFFSADVSAQKKKVSADRKKTTTSNQPASKSVKNQVSDRRANKKPTVKESAAKQISAKDKQDASKKDKSASGKNTKDNIAATAKTRQADLKKQAEERRLAEIRQAEAARRREIEAARRQAALEEKHRREQAAREARARRIAFERGLRTETIANIAADNTEGEDLEVRRAAISALGNRAGMIVVMEAQTGKILSVVNQDWAIHHGYKPCSTIKLVTAIGGLNENVINPYDGSIPARPFPMNLNDALAFSNNKYFQNVGSNLGNRKMLTYAQMLGLGRPTGINSEGETGGRLPFGNSNARVYSHGDDFEVSPLQLAVMVSAVSNHGKIIVPHVPRTAFEKTNFRGTLRRQINLPQTSLQGVLPGMVGAATYGTARRGVDSSMGVAGKTGSCIADGSWVGLFTSVAPIENPQYAVVVITRGQSERGKYAAAVAGKIYQALRSRIRAKRVENIAKLVPETKPQPQINAKTSAQIDEIAGEDSEDNDTAAKKEASDEKEIIVEQTTQIVEQTTQEVTAPKPVQKNVVKAGAKSSALFPTVVINVRKPQGEGTRPRIVTNK
ncbi:MAG TPA: penicillin-binding transpeptidase domain-containing protein [Pyrinomonadaceae bacterium]|nr:penicillin-binding transpeptidase domain-containing protein [Pyrinomonadaceae bacterium]